jgi:hypothetical protein
MNSIQVPFTFEFMRLWMRNKETQVDIGEVMKYWQWLLVVNAQNP